MRITHLGHACVLIEAAGSRVLIDPGSFSGLWHEVTDLDAVLITHQHQDHLDPQHVPTLLQNNPRAEVYAAEDVRQAVELPGAHSVQPGERFTVGQVQVEAVGGQHAVIHEEMPRVHNIGYILRAEDEPVFFHPGDALDTAPEGIDVLALPLMGPWAALREHVEFLRELGVPRVNIPIHDELLSDQGRAVFTRMIGTLTGAEFTWLRGGKSEAF